MGASGPKAGLANPGAVKRYEVGSGKIWRPNPGFPAALAERLFLAMESTGRSALGIIGPLLAAALDEQGRVRPEYAHLFETEIDGQGVLPSTLRGLPAAAPIPDQRATQKAA